VGKLKLRPASKRKRDQLIVYGANCVWWDAIEKCATKKTPEMTGPGLPCCPHCGSVLFQVEETTWRRNVAKHEAGGNPGYRALMEWMRGKCFPTMTAARRAYAAAHLMETN